MNIQIFGTSKSFDTKKAERWFKERRIKFQSVDLKRYGMSWGELKSVCQAVGLEALIDPKHPDAALLHYLASDQAKLDEEGCQIMRNLGRNMAWILRCIEAGKAAGIEPPQAESGKQTNFIR